MTSNPSILRRTYDGIALFAFLNMLALGGVLIYVLGAGVIDGEKVRQIAAALREEEPQTEVTERRHLNEQTTEPISQAVGGDALAESQMNLEIVRREAERIKAELDQRLALSNSILLRVMTERESFREEREKAQQQQEIASAQQNQEAFKKQIAIYEALAPKIALQHLLTIPDPDEAAEVLLAVNTRKAKSIIEAAKRSEDLEKMKTILRRMRERATHRSAEPGSEEP